MAGHYHDGYVPSGGSAFIVMLLDGADHTESVPNG
jgi:hypothetical protein